MYSRLLDDVVWLFRDVNFYDQKKTTLTRISSVLRWLWKQSLNLWKSPRSREFRRINLRISEETLTNKNSLKLEVYSQMMTQAGFRLHGDGRRKGGNDEVRETCLLISPAKQTYVFLLVKFTLVANSLLIAPLWVTLYLINRLIQ